MRQMKRESALARKQVLGCAAGSWGGRKGKLLLLSGIQIPASTSLSKRHTHLLVNEDCKSSCLKECSEDGILFLSDRHSVVPDIPCFSASCHFRGGGLQAACPRVALAVRGDLWDLSFTLRPPHSAQPGSYIVASLG